MLSKLKDEELLEAYKKAIEIQLQKDFITVLEKELIVRGLISSKISH